MLNAGLRVSMLVEKRTIHELRDLHSTGCSVRALPGQQSMLLGRAGEVQWQHGQGPSNASHTRGDSEPLHADSADAAILLVLRPVLCAPLRRCSQRGT